ncbi:ABC transporter permease [Chitinophaga sp.]|uniref:ABC transporter permease n=1 Tax=Chitinophaga sp. TaxID=1869181 RepID=UPI002F94780B
MLRNYLIAAFRNFFRSRVYSIINIAGLSLGLACAMLIILYIKDEVSYDRFHANAKQIYRIFAEAASPQGEVRRMGITGDVQGPLFASKIPEIKAFVRVFGGQADIKNGAEISSTKLLSADANFFTVFTFPLLSGNPKTALLETNSVVLSEAAARKYFGSTAVLGKNLLMKRGDRFEEFVVTGVAKRCPQNSSLQFDVLLPHKASPDMEHGSRRWNSFYLNTYVLLYPHADISAVEAKMTKAFADDAPDVVKQMEEATHAKLSGGYRLQPFTDIHLNNNIDRNDISGASNLSYSFILSCITGFILLIACINFVNLTIARSLKRAKEIGVRKVMGGNRKQLVIQFLGESTLLCLLAFGIAIIMLLLAIPVFNQLADKNITLSSMFDMKLLTGYLVLFLVTSGLAGFYPAMVLSRYNPVKVLYGRFSFSGKNYLQKTLVVIQFTLASFLICATFIIFSQFSYLTTKKLGYDDSNLVLVNKAGLTRGEARLFREELMKYPNILGLAAKDNGYSFNGGKINEDAAIGFANVAIDESYIPLLKIPILKGRNFSSGFPSDSSGAVIVNESFVKKAGWKEPIGQQVIMNGAEKYRVIGVVKDYHFQSLSQEIGPELFSMKGPDGFGMAYIKIAVNSETASLLKIERVFKKLFPLVPYSFEFKDQENRKNYEVEARWKQIMLSAAVLTIFISCIGLFGLSVFYAEKRTKEIGIRKVLGASVGRVVAILSMDFLKLIMIALLISIPLAWITADKWLQNYPYRIPLSGFMFAPEALLVVLMALVTISFQAIKAAIADPVSSLRSE